MPTNLPITVFDVIGRIMVGPSSSHTAGAVRIGNIARSLLGCTPQEALIELHGSFAETGRGHGTDKALLAGLLGLDPSDGRIRDSYRLAEETGLRFKFVDVDLGEDVHPNTARLTLKAGGDEVVMAASSIGGGLVRITEIKGYMVDFSGELDTLLIIAADSPGTINAITGWLRELNINVAFFRVTRQKRGGEAIMALETDQPVPDAVISLISSLPWVKWCRKLPASN